MTNLILGLIHLSNLEAIGKAADQALRSGCFSPFNLACYINCYINSHVLVTSYLSYIHYIN